MKVFTDLHHSDLYYSLYLLFEERLGFELYRPIGYDWYHQGFWKIGDPYPTPLDTARQYLDINSRKWDQYKNLNELSHIDDNIYMVKEPIHNYFQRAITLDTFKSMKFDMIISTFPDHHNCYEQLRNKFQPKAQHVAQLGNISQQTNVPFVLSSVPFTPRPNQEVLYYHQEVDMRHYNYVKPPTDVKRIYSMVNCLPFPELFHKYNHALKDIDMKAYGGGSPNGGLRGMKGVSKKMQEANMGWHVRLRNELFGHTAMGWFASGRPMIVKMSQILKLTPNSLSLFEPGVTCIDIDGSNLENNCNVIRQALEPENNIKMCENAYKRFHEVINYDKEEQMVRKFLERIL